MDGGKKSGVMTQTAIPILHTVAGLSTFLRFWSVTAAAPGTIRGRLGFVPTMGALHPGHLSLVRRARQENACVIVSIFVNPLQFGPTEDFSQYPRDLDADLALCEANGVDAVFVPQAAELLATQPMTQVCPPEAMLRVLCGRARPGHFQGVATIVTKLLALIQPDRAYFGRKDAQQLAILQRTVADLNLRTTLVPCPTIRNEQGLAFSSRNQYLTRNGRALALRLNQSLSAAQDKFQGGQRDRQTLLSTVQATLAKNPDIALEYVELVDPDTLTPLAQVDRLGLLAIAAKVENTRLIDNVMLDARPPILAIDGPAGAGKSTVTRNCAAQLGLLYLDTGAMYRAMTWLVLQAGVPLDHEVAIADLVSQARIDLQPGQQPTDPLTVWVNGQNVTQAIRSRDVTRQVSIIAAQPSVRDILRQQQQAYGKVGGVAAEGRDIGTHIFPDAGLKIFLTASIAERAHRRLQELQAAGEYSVSYETLTQEIAERDRLDSERAVAPLCKADDALEILTDGLSIAEVTEKIVHLYHERTAARVCAV